MKKFAVKHLLLTCLCIPSLLFAQEEEESQMIIPPLFEYIEAPDDLPDLRSRTDYLMDNFWNPFDFKNTNIVDQNALNHAFGVYVQAMPYATQSKVMESSKKLISKIKGNPGLSYQFAKAAEENLYGPRADVTGDEIYMLFIQNLVDNKKVRDSLKEKYKNQLYVLKRTARGVPFPELSLRKEDGSFYKVTEPGVFGLVELTGKPDEDTSYTNLRLDISSVANNLIEDGKLKVTIINYGVDSVKFNIPDKWNIVNSENVSKELDIRTNPCFYLIDTNGKIIGKNLDVDTVLELLDAAVKQ